MWSIILKLITLSIAMIFIGWVVPGVRVSSFTSAFIASIVIVLINAFIKPVLMFFALPINILTLGISALLINGLLFSFVAYLVSGVEVENFLSAVIAAIILSLLSIGISYL